MKSIVILPIMLAGLFALSRPLLADEAYTACIDANTTNSAWAECGAALGRARGPKAGGSLEFA